MYSTQTGAEDLHGTLLSFFFFIIFYFPLFFFLFFTPYISSCKRDKGSSQSANLAVTYPNIKGSPFFFVICLLNGSVWRHQFITFIFFNPFMICHCSSNYPGCKSVLLTFRIDVVTPKACQIFSIRLLAAMAFIIYIDVRGNVWCAQLYGIRRGFFIPERGRLMPQIY